MSDLILGDDWVGAVHQAAGERFGAGAAEELTIVCALARNACKIPDAPFLTQAGDDLPFITYAKASRELERRAGSLASWRLKRGERIGILGQNSIDLVMSVLAVLRAGGVAVLLSPSDPASRIALHAEFTQTRFLLYDSACESLAQACAGRQRLCSFNELAEIATAHHELAGPPPRPTDAALIFFTSGTTGAPKAVVQSHYAVAQNAWSLAAHHRIGPGVRLLCVLPLHHVNALEFTIFAVLLGGGHAVISLGFDPLRFWNTVRGFGIHIASLVPNLLRLLAERPGLRGEEALALRYAVCAAAPLSTEIAQLVLDRLGCRIVQGYGLSEVTNFSCLMPVEASDEEYERWMLRGRRTSVGPSLPHQEVEIWAEETLAPPGVEGEIVIRGHCVMSGYLHNAAATAEAFRSGWFHTGDLGYWLPDGSGRKLMHVSGRLREIAKRSGETVSLLELDEVLASIPGVADAVAVALANAWVDEEIAAVVVRQPGSIITEEDIAGSCRRLLSFSAMPKAIEFVEEIPRTPTGKICRHAIAERFAGLRERLFTEANSSTLRNFGDETHRCRATEEHD